MGIVLAVALQWIVEERIDGWIRRLGEDDLRTRGRTAGGLLDCGKAALPALYKVYETPPSDEVKFRAGWLIERILQPILEEIRKKYRRRDDDTVWQESVSPYLPGCRIFRWSLPCHCCALHRGGHGGGSLVLSMRDATTFTPAGLLAKPELFRRHVRPVKDEKDAQGLVESLFGPDARAIVEKGEDGIVVRVGGRLRPRNFHKHIRDLEGEVPLIPLRTCTLRFDLEGRLVSCE